MSFARRRFAQSVLALVILAAAQTTATQPPNSDPFWRTFSSGSTTSDSVRWHHVTGGSGDTIVLLHGWPQTWFEWHDVMPQLSQRFRVIAVDLPGLGESGDADRYDQRAVSQRDRAPRNLHRADPRGVRRRARLQVIADVPHRAVVRRIHRRL